MITTLIIVIIIILLMVINIIFMTGKVSYPLNRNKDKHKKDKSLS